MGVERQQPAAQDTYEAEVAVSRTYTKLRLHNGYKGRWQAKLIWIYPNTTAFQNCVYEYARDHR